MKRQYKTLYHYTPVNNSMTLDFVRISEIQYRNNIQRVLAQNGVKHHFEHL